MRIFTISGFSASVLGIFFSSQLYGLSLFSFFQSKPKLFEEVCRNPEKYSLDQQRLTEKIIYETGLSRESKNDCRKIWKKAKYVKKLDLSEFNIGDISILADFRRLEDLSLKGNYISDLRPLRNMKNLRHLDASDNCLKDLGTVSHIRFRSLDVRKNILSKIKIQEFDKFTNPGQKILLIPQEVEKIHCGLMGESERLKAETDCSTGPEASENGVMYVSESGDSEEESSHRIVRESAHPTSPLVDELLTQLAGQGVRLKDVIMLEDIQDSEGLFSALKSLGLTNCGVDTVIQSLLTLTGLLEDLSSDHGDNPIRPFLDYHTQPATILNKLTFNRKLLNQVTGTKSYTRRLRELKESGDFDPEFYVHFYQALTRNTKILSNSVYPGGDGDLRTLIQKKSDLVLLLAAVKGVNNGTEAVRRISPSVFATGPERYSSAGQSENWFSELQFKLYHLYKVFPFLNPDRQATLISYLLHGGRNCSDAKWNAINDAFRAYCPAEAESLKEEDTRVPRDANDVITQKINLIKSDYLGRYLNQYVDSQSRYREEACTYFNTTWDALAPGLGLSPVGSRYANFVMREAVRDFDPGFYSLITPTVIYKALSEDLTTLLRRNYLGVLSQLLPDQEYLVIGLLRYYEVLF